MEVTISYINDGERQTTTIDVARVRRDEPNDNYHELWTWDADGELTIYKKGRVESFTV